MKEAVQVAGQETCKNSLHFPLQFHSSAVNLKLLSKSLFLMGRGALQKGDDIINKLKITDGILQH